MIDNKTTYLQLPLPDPANTLAEDVLRIQQAFNAVDQALGTLQQNSITQGDSAVTVADSGVGGKVTVKLDNVESASFSQKYMVVPKGTTAERPATAELGTLRYNTTTGFFETYTVSGWGSIAAPPMISTFTPTTFNGEQGTEITINGAFFDAGSTVRFVTQTGLQLSAGSVTFVTSAQIKATVPRDILVSEGPLAIQVTNGAGLSVTSSPILYPGSVPDWNTPSGTLVTTSKWNDPVSVYVSAADDGTIAEYAIESGALPSGVTLNGATGQISGTAGAQNTTTYNFTIKATDNAGNTSSRLFSLVITNAVPTWVTPSGTLVTTTKWNSPISTTISATDPEGQSVSYSIVSGSLPTGVTLNASSGLISGTAGNQATTTYNFTAKSTDAQGGQSATRAFALQIVNAAPTWSSPAASATFSTSVGNAFSLNLSAVDPEGQAVSYSIQTGTLPTGLSLSGNVISGTPTSAGSSALTIRASDGYSTADRSFTLVIDAVGQAAYTTAGTYTWVAPATVYKVSAVCVGGGGAGGAAYYAGGGGGGGGLGYKNNIDVTPGNSYTVVVGAGGVGVSANSGGMGGNGGDSYFISASTVRGGGGAGGVGTSSEANAVRDGGLGGGYFGDGGGNGGNGGASQGDTAGGGGGAGGYAGSGGSGGVGGGSQPTSGSGGGGGGGGAGGDNGPSGAAASGGGVGLLGQGSNGSAGSNQASSGAGYGSGGSGGANGSGNLTAGGSQNTGGAYGGGGGGQSNDAKTTPGCNGGIGAVRLIWPSSTRVFPATNTGNL